MPKAIDGDTSTASQVVSRRSGHLLAHVRDPRAGGGGGVELAHVVAGLVGAQLRELGARADAGGAVLARDDAARAPDEGEVERLDERGRDGPGALAAGRRGQSELGGLRAPPQAARVSPSTGRRSGSGTASSTLSSRSSGRVPSLRPS